jgi:hypothetical protein
MFFVLFKKIASWGASRMLRDAKHGATNKGGSWLTPKRKRSTMPV